MILPVTYIKIKRQNCRNQKAHTVSAAEVGGINNVRPPSMQSLLRKKVAGLGAKYLKSEENCCLTLLTKKIIDT
jgi:hypothetical protein